MIYPAFILTRLFSILGPEFNRQLRYNTTKQKTIIIISNTHFSFSVTLCLWYLSHILQTTILERNSLYLSKGFYILSYFGLKKWFSGCCRAFVIFFGLNFEMPHGNIANARPTGQIQHLFSCEDRVI